MRKSLLLGLAALVLGSTGCRSLFTSGSNTVKSPWKDFAQAQTAFDLLPMFQPQTGWRMRWIFHGRRPVEMASPVLFFEERIGSQADVIEGRSATFF